MEYGNVPYNVMKRSVRRLMRQTREEVTNARPGSDCAFFKWSGGSASAQITCNRFCLETGLIRGRNRLLTAAAEPTVLLVTIVLAPEEDEATVKDFMKVISSFAEKTKISLGNVSVMTLPNVREGLCNLTFLGQAKCVPTPDRKKLAGKDLVMAGAIGREGTYLLACKNRAEIDAKLPAFFADRALAMGKELTVERICEAASCECMFPADEGGIFAALWNLGEYLGCGFEVDLKAIPILQETVEITEVFGLNPYAMATTGTVLIVTENGEELVDCLTNLQIDAAKVGQIQDNNDKIIKNGEEIRFLDLPKADEVYRCI